MMNLVSKDDLPGHMIASMAPGLDGLQYRTHDRPPLLAPIQPDIYERLDVAHKNTAYAAYAVRFPGLQARLSAM
jgi:hypothetical protein